jgi:winged helix DNA-binding protein
VPAARFTSQLLAGPPARSPIEVVGRILSVQAQDLRAARLAVRARSAGLVASDVDRCLDGGELVVTWLNRVTLHLVRREDYFWLHALLAPLGSAGSVRRLAQEGVPPADADRGVAAVARALASDGPLTRAQLGERVASVGVRIEGQALIHVLHLACMQGVAVRGPVRGRDQAYVLVRDWMGKPPPVDRDAALGELGRRYLAGHAPGDDRDLARWTGLPLRDARTALRDARVPEGPEDTPRPRLLGAFDPVLFGWTSRDWILGDLAPTITVGGVFRAFALLDGRAAGRWQDVAADPTFDAERADVERFFSG